MNLQATTTLPTPAWTFAAYQWWRRLSWVRRLIELGSISTAGAIEAYESHDGDLWAHVVFYAVG
jgi:hypothetical protein